MYNFTDNPCESMMKRRPRQVRVVAIEPPTGSRCCGCSCWQGIVCVGFCIRAMNLLRKIETSGKSCPKSF